MGISFSYHTLEDVSRKVLSEQREWATTEPFIFFEVEGFADQIYGDSKFFWARAAKPAPGEISDAQYIVNGLCDWSRRLGLTWQITAMEAEVGVIANGEPDEQVKSFISTLEDPSVWQDLD